MTAETSNARGEWVLVPRALVDSFPEINPSNYDHGDACALNAWGVELVLAAKDTAPPPAAARGDGWKPSSVEPPHNPKKGSLGTEYLIYPPTSGGDRTAFYGRRLGGAACWYRYGAQVHGVDYWHELPAIPAALTGERNG